jgi:diguanylate cyclase (GGDEF)-like protein
MADKLSNESPNSMPTDSLPCCPGTNHQCLASDQLIALQQSVSELQEQLRVDLLTGLFNYRYFVQSLAQEMERSRRSAQATALVMVDLDYFKKFNDRWGHEAGNQALIAAARAIKHTVRQLDIPCRYGGEEFAIILPSTELRTAVQVAERIRSAIESVVVMVDGSELSLTASLGVDVYNAFHEESPENFVRRTDSFLYQAKEKGRNQVSHGYSDDVTSHVAVSSEERDALSDLFGDGRSEEE